MASSVGPLGDDIVAFLTAMQEARNGVLPLLELPEWAAQQVAAVMKAGSIDSVAVAVRQCPTQAEPIRIHSADSEEIALDVPVITVRPSFLYAWQRDPGAGPVLISIAHELGHFASGHFDHPVQGNRQGQDRELEADAFAGGVAARLGLSRQDVGDWVASLSHPNGCPTHPPHAARLEAALRGFDGAEAQTADSPGSAYTSPSATGFPSVGRGRS